MFLLACYRCHFYFTFVGVMFLLACYRCHFYFSFVGVMFLLACYRCNFYFSSVKFLQNYRFCVTSVRSNLRILHRRHKCNYCINIYIYVSCVRMFMIYIFTKFNLVPEMTHSLSSQNRRKEKRFFWTAAMLLFLTVQMNHRIICQLLFEHLLSYCI
jgi:hypothetical protein